MQNCETPTSRKPGVIANQLCVHYDSFLLNCHCHVKGHTVNDELFPDFSVWDQLQQV